LFPAWRAALIERARGTGETEQPLTRWVGPTLSPPSVGKTVALSIAAVDEVDVAPRQRLRPIRMQRSSSVAIEVKLLVELDHEAVLERQIPRSGLEPTGSIVSPQVSESGFPESAREETMPGRIPHLAGSGYRPKSCWRKPEGRGSNPVRRAEALRNSWDASLEKVGENGHFPFVAQIRLFVDSSRVDTNQARTAACEEGHSSGDRSRSLVVGNHR